MSSSTVLVDALQERVGDLQPHGLVEREELLKELVRTAMSQAYLKPVTKVDRGLRSRVTWHPRSSTT